MRLGVIILGIATFLPLPTLGAEGISVRLEPLSQSVSVGQTPQFRVTVRAGSNLARVMKYGDREDLRHNYARLLVTQKGARVELVPYISDPGPTDAKDYVDLAPGASITFTHDGSPYPLRHLKQGSYSAYVLLQPDWSMEPIKSNIVGVKVVAP
jgi:hypothetical protein